VSNTTINGNATFSFSLPRTANVSVGTVSTSSPGTSATISNSGTNGDVVLNFSIPRGDPGLDGTDTVARITANSAYNHSNSAYAHANAAFVQANLDFTNITTSAGTYGNTTAIPVITLEANGRVRSISTSTIAVVPDSLQNVTIRGATTANAITITNSTASVNTTTGALIVTGGVGIGGALNATTKSFNIPHPTKKGKTLRYGSLEGPEYGVYVRGQTKEKIIKLPTYWTKLVDANTITVNLTPIGSHQELFVEKIEKNKVYIKNQSGKEINCFFIVFAERADVDKLEVE